MAMEKVVKAKNKFLMLLPKAASAVTFQKPPFSPNREIKRLENATKLKSHIGKGYPAPIRSFIPAEARRKSKNSIQEEEEEEPTSPKVSCMGQIKHKHKQQKHDQKKKKTIKKKIKKSLSLPKDINNSVCDEEAKKKKEMKNIGKIFGGLKLKPGRKSDVTGSGRESQLSEERAPSLSQMKRFASSRDHFTNFDWKAPQIAPVGMESDHIHRDIIDDYYSDDQESEEEEDLEEFRIPFSAPILLVSTNTNRNGDIAMEPRKEVNLWKRRTMAQPRPLQLKPPFLSN